MKHGAEWYKREPVAFLGGVQGMTAKEIAVYTVVLDLIYQHGGWVNNDPSWFAGWIKDMGAAAVRSTVASLVVRGKLILEGDRITNERAKTQAKTKENLSENRAEIGKKGGISSGVSRSRLNENNDLGEPIASPREDKRRIEKKEDTDVSSSVPKVDMIKSHFSDFWEAYPHRHGKKTKRPDAERAFINAVRSGVTVQQIADGVVALKRDPDVERGFQRGPVPWLNQKGWNDEIPDQPNYDRDRHGISKGRKDGPDPALANLARLAGLR